MEKDYEIVTTDDAEDPVISKIEPRSEILGEIMNDLPKKLPKKTRDRIVYFLKALNREKISM